MALGRELNVSLSLANITEQILIDGINRGWGDKSAYTATFKLEEEAVQVCSEPMVWTRGDPTSIFLLIRTSNE